MSESIKYLSLFDLQALIKQKIDASHPMPYWVVAEVSELKVNYSGHCYIELVEKGGANAVPKAKVNAVIWRTQYNMISSYFRTATGGELQAGIKILVKVHVTYHELYGLSFQITDIEPSFTLGDLESQKRETIERLQKEGIYDMNRESDLPLVIQRLAVVSSRNAAGYQDFVNELASNSGGYRYEISLFDAFMQGNDAEDSIISALDDIAERMDDFDAVILIRGGGSQSDLGAFNSYRMCSHIAQFPLPVVAGIGHDKDKSVADLVARLSLKTPTAVAVALSEHNAAFENELDNVMNGILSIASDRIEEEKFRLNESGFLLREISSRLINGIYTTLNGIQAAIENRSRLLVEYNKGALNLLLSNLASRPSMLTGISKHKLAVLESSLTERALSMLDTKSREIGLIQNIIEAKTPERILKMGYSIVRSKGKVVKSIKDVLSSDNISVQLSDGTVDAKIK